MAKVKSEKVLNFTAQQMYNLVNDVTKYPEFLPWCESVEVKNETETTLDASLKISKAGITFGTRNQMIVNEEIKMGLLKGPFKSLDGAWKFKKIDENKSKISLDMSFSFNNKLLAMTFGAMFNKLLVSMLDAFCKRAESLYGVSND